MKKIALAFALLLAACAPREWLLPKIGLDTPALRDFPADFTPPLSAETNQPMPGFGGGGGGLHRPPVIFVHGNTVSARFWLPARETFLAHGYTGDELWAFGYGWDNPRYFDSNDLSVPSLERAVNAVTQYLEKKTGHPVPQVDIVAHSLGVTLVRQWMLQTDSFHRVRRFVAVCGANHGVWTAWPDARGQNRTVSFELAPDSPWLAQLNRVGETPGSTRYMTVYDGSGWNDVLFPAPHESSPALEGAENLPFDVQRHAHFDHMELPRAHEPLEAMLEWLRHGPLPRMSEAPPRIERSGAHLSAAPAGAQLRCTQTEIYPDAQTPAAAELDLPDGAVYTCYADDPRTGLASPMQRYSALAAAPAATAPRAQPAGGRYEQPQSVTLDAGDPKALIVYTTSGTAPDAGSPRYAAPIYVAAPLTLRARVLKPDGELSPEIAMHYDISLERVDRAHTLQRQFDPDAALQDPQRRPVGR